MIWLTNLMIDASWAAAAVLRSMSSSFCSMTVTSSSPAPIDCSVSAPTPSTRLAVRSISAAGARAGQHVDAGREAQLVERAGVEHAAGRDDDAVRRVRQREQPVLQQQAGRELADQLLRRVGAFELDVGDLELLGEVAEQLLLGRAVDAGGRHRLVDGVVQRPAGGLQLAGLDGRGLVQQPFTDQHGNDIAHGFLAVSRCSAVSGIGHGLQARVTRSTCDFPGDEPVGPTCGRPDRYAAADVRPPLLVK